MAREKSCFISLIFSSDNKAVLIGYSATFPWWNRLKKHKLGKKFPCIISFSVLFRCFSKDFWRFSWLESLVGAEPYCSAHQSLFVVKMQKLMPTCLKQNCIWRENGEGTFETSYLVWEEPIAWNIFGVTLLFTKMFYLNFQLKNSEWRRIMPDVFKRLTQKWQL